MGTAKTLIWTTTSGISFLSHPDCDLELYVECKNGHVTFLWRQLRTRSINANANFSKNDYRVVEPNAKCCSLPIHCHISEYIIYIPLLSTYTKGFLFRKFENKLNSRCICETSFIFPEEKGSLISWSTYFFERSICSRCKNQQGLCPGVIMVSLHFFIYRRYWWY